MKHLTSFEIHAFRNVRPTRLEFRPGVNVVLGRNAAGKTTFLKLIESSTNLFAAAEPRDVSYEIGDDKDHVLRRLRTQRREGVDPRGSALFAREESFSFDLGGQVASAKFGEGEVFVDGVPSSAGEYPFLDLLRQIGAKYGDQTVERLLSIGFCNSKRLDEALEYFTELLAFSQTRTGEEVRSEPRFSQGLPAGLHRFQTSISPNGPSFSPDFLGRAAKVMGYEQASALVDLESKASGLSVETKYSNIRFLFQSGGDKFLHQSLSFGEKRLMSFFAASDASDVVLADELVNGLHHDWIEACLEEIGLRQAFLTSQNPLLLDYLQFDDAEDVRRGFVLCQRQRHPEKGVELLWRNPSKVEAEEFFEAYETGIQSVSQILISKGFW
jgi:hypothetical protein